MGVGGRTIKFYLAGIYPEVEKIRQPMNVGIKENGGRERAKSVPCTGEYHNRTETSFNLTGLLYK